MAARTSNPTVNQGVSDPRTMNRPRSNAEPQLLVPFIESTIESIEDYGRQKPWSFGLWMMGLGFVIGWKLKPW